MNIDANKVIEYYIEENKQLKFQNVVYEIQLKELEEKLGENAESEDD